MEDVVEGFDTELLGLGRTIPLEPLNLDPYPGMSSASSTKS